MIILVGIIFFLRIYVIFELGLVFELDYFSYLVYRFIEVFLYFGYLVDFFWYNYRIGECDKVMIFFFNCLRE